MKIVLSRKGFDSASGGGPSPIIAGRPTSLPIPAGPGQPGVSYASLGLSPLVETASRGRVRGRDLAHHDPMFLPDGSCLFGQCGAAQTHLENQQVGRGDLFFFFGLFREARKRPHHRIFGWLRVEQVVRHGDPQMAGLAALGHPHALQPHAGNDAIWCGRGRVASIADPGLRLSVPEGPPSLWQVPPWLARCGLSYHGRADRWSGEGRLRSVGRGQEFVSDVGGDQEALAWTERITAMIG